MGRIARVSWEELPLFASDKDLGSAVVGPERAAHWASVTVKNLERHGGFPKFDEAHGGRYTPAVKRFYEAMHETKASRQMPIQGIPGTWADGRQKRSA